MDNYAEHEAIVKKHSENEIKMIERRESLQMIIENLFKEIGRDKTMQEIRKDLLAGRRASVRTFNPKTFLAPKV